ncbi:MAG: TonB family protein [Proteobacteria bacterium]|nr:TonB family protein [Pseudomonadota bacterium]
MPSASVLYAFPAPLGRRGTAAVVVAGLHVVLVTALITSMVITRPPPTDEFRPPAPQIPRIEDPAPSRPALSGPSWQLRPRVPDPTPVVLPLVDPPPVGMSQPTQVTLSPPESPTALLRPVRVTHSEEPLYPASARRLGEEGVVVVRVLVGADGHAAVVDVATSSGSPRLDSAALAAVRRWTFQPAANGAGPVASYSLVRIVFRLTS